MRRTHIVDLGKTDANMFGRAPHRGIDGVQIKISMGLQYHAPPSGR